MYLTLFYLFIYMLLFVTILRLGNVSELSLLSLNHNLELTLELVHVRTSPSKLCLVAHLTTTFTPFRM